jgi:transcriptional regulator with XRE-family HTH domain
MKANLATSNPISRCLRDAIKKSGMSVAEISGRANVGQFFIYDVVAGKSRNPSAVKLARIAEVLGVPLEVLVNARANEASEVHDDKKSAAEARFIMLSDHFIKLNEGDTLRPLDDVLHDVLLHAVKWCNNDKAQAARALGIGRTALYRKLGMHHEVLSQVHREKLAKKQEKRDLEYP